MAVDRKQQMKEITERLEQGVKDIFTSEMYTTYLRTMAKFHNYLLQYNIWQTYRNGREALRTILK